MKSFEIYFNDTTDDVVLVESTDPDKDKVAGVSTLVKSFLANTDEEAEKLFQQWIKQLEDEDWEDEFFGED